MTSLQLAKRIASIVVYGHLALFSFGLLVTSIGPYNTIDIAQMILMGSPLLAMVGISAYHFMSKLPREDTSDIADPAWTRMSTITTTAFLLALFIAYSLAAIDTTIKASTLKLAVGSIETVLGSYLGINRDVMFPDKVAQRS